jgi:O-acetyl-ADP-ribose deacetylase (regulator of RNase III)
MNILLECIRRSASSVAMPLIGTGKRRFPEDFVLRVMREEFEKFSSMYLPGTLKQIKLVRYDQGGRRTTVQAQPLSGELLKNYQILLSSKTKSTIKKV